MGKARCNVWISHENHKRLDACASQPGVSKAAIVDAALEAWFDPDKDAMLESIILKRLGDMDERYNDLEANVRVSNETLGQFVLYWLTLTEPLRTGERDEAQRIGRKRFDRFLDQVSVKLRTDDSLTANMRERLTEG